MSFLMAPVAGTASVPGVSTFLTALISSTLCAAIISGLFALMQFFATERLKNRIKSEFDEKLETHKAQLKATSDVELEKLKSNLGIIAAQRQVQYAHLQERRAEIVAETYRLLKAAHKGVSLYIAVFEIAGGPTRDERRDAAALAGDAFSNFFVANEVFFPASTAKQLEALRLEYINSFNEFALFVDRKNGGDTNRWLAISEKLDGSLKQALKRVEQDFRHLLGDDSD